MGALARHRLSLLNEIWQEHSQPEWRLLLKIADPVSETDEEQGRAHHWYESRTIGTTETEAWLLGSGSEGEQATTTTVQMENLSAFMLVTGEERWGPIRLPELALRLDRTGSARRVES
jgi:hypothetical protein